MDKIKRLFEGLAKAALERVEATGDGLTKYRAGTANYDIERDGLFTSLSEYSDAVSEIRELSVFQERFGGANAGRITLQFIYELLGRLTETVLRPSQFEDCWSSFVGEIDKEDWSYVGVANLQNFHSDLDAIDLGDGISIRGRSFEALRNLLGWTDYELDAMTRDWMDGGGASSFILLVEHQVPKTPTNIMLANVRDTYEKAQRALLVMRLYKPGDIRIGRFWEIRPAAFQLLGGLSSLSGGVSGFNFGSNYQLEKTDTEPLRELYLLLKRFQTSHEASLQNVATAVRAFTSIYDRSMFHRPDRVIDGITALEALLPTNAELSFKLAVRGSGLLARDDSERERLFQAMNGY